MQTERRRISPLIIYTVIAALTNLTLTVGSLLILQLTNSLKNSSFIYFFLGILVYGVLIGLVVGSLSRRMKQTTTLKAIGYLPGRLCGVAVGFLLGNSIAKTWGGLLGAVLFFYLGRWVGPKISGLIGKQFLSYLPDDTGVPEQPVLLTPPWKKMLLVVYVVIAPLTNAFLAWFVFQYHIQVSVSAEWLLVLRIGFILMALIAVLAPWVVEKRTSMNAPLEKTTSDTGHIPLGLAFTIVPAVLGSMLCLFGGSIEEALIFAFVSSMAALFWGIRDSSRIKVPGGGEI